MKIGYYAIVEKDRKDPGFYNVSFPDIYPGVTFGKSFDDAIFMAKDLLKLMVEEAPHQCFPPKDYGGLRKEFPKRHLEYIEVDADLTAYEAYQKSKEK